MTYDADGLRNTKTVNGVKTEYQYVGDKLYYENRGNGDSFYYFYDSYGKLSAIYHHRNGTKVAYHVLTNSQGDVIALYSWAGALVATYEYDAWGNCTILSDTSSTGIATLNPMRYRGYYYDKDLGLYYLQSRYYDAEIGRFINADGYISTGQGVTSYNMFAYCNNNPVMYIDPRGTDSFEVVEFFDDLIEFMFKMISITSTNSTSTQITTSDSTKKKSFEFLDEISVLSIVLESLIDIEEEINSETELGKIIWDFSIETGFDVVTTSVGTMIGTKIGGLIGAGGGTFVLPVIGTVSGGTIGIVVGLIVTPCFVSILDYALEDTKDWLKGLYP